MTPEHPDWKPWWVRYAEFEGRRLVLADRTLTPEAHRAHSTALDRLGRYGVGLISNPLDCMFCGLPEAMYLGGHILSGDDLAAAIAAFEQAERDLIASAASGGDAG